ncbi:MAG: helix-turn-helix domain-containing protein [Clostridia bacterium]|nr:helix-turn-helix domain-containing protein [Clostridia bacterium]
MTEEYRLHEKKLPGLNPLGFGQQNCPPGFSVSVPRPYYMIHFVFSGAGTLTTGGRVYPIGPMQMFILPPHKIHTYTADAQNPWRYAWILFEADCPLPPILQADVVSAPACAPLFASLSDVAAYSCGQTEALAAKIWELFSLLLRQTAEQPFALNPYVTRAKQYIADRFAEKIKVADVAKYLGLDRSYFSALFRKETGLCPQDFLTGYKLERAAHYLVTENARVAAAAEYAGYGDLVNFSRMFKKHFGISPSKYRETLLASETNFEIQNSDK